jgi:hypothetical protein
MTTSTHPDAPPPSRRPAPLPDDDLLVAYALGALDPADRAAVEAHLAACPEDAAKVDRVRLALRPLEADRDGYDPPPGLVAATLARTAEYIVAHGLLPAAGPGDLPAVPSSVLRRADAEPVFPTGWRRADALVAACIAFMAFGLLVAGIGRLRHDSQVMACQDRLRELHVALSGYSDVHNGRYPEVGTRQVPVAGAFAAELARAGHVPPGQPVGCPLAEPAPLPALAVAAAPPVGYAYTLGYLGPDGRVTGLRRADFPGGAPDWMAVAADLPPRPGTPHPRGMNVLYVGGMVRFSTTPAAGMNGDDIYHNDAGLVRAGLHVYDASLGRPPDVP